MAGVLLGSVGLALAPGPVPDNPVPVENPFGVEAAGGALAAVRSAEVAMVLAAALVRPSRCWSATAAPVQVPRHQLKWLFWTVSVVRESFRPAHRARIADRADRRRRGA